MSYARKSSTSDVYVFQNGADDKFDCHECELTNQTEKFDNAVALVDHLEEHIETGHKVPDETLQRLTEYMGQNERKTAFLCAWIEVEEVIEEIKDSEVILEERPVIKGIGVFSEPEPARLGSKGAWSRVLERDGETFEAARADLKSFAKQWLPWLFDHVNWEE